MGDGTVLLSHCSTARAGWELPASLPGLQGTVQGI